MKDEPQRWGGRRRRGVRTPQLFLCALPISAVLSFSCGSRTGLFAAGEAEAPLDAGFDAPRPVDATTVRDTAPETLPTIDATPRDANFTDCPDAAATLIYVLTEQEQLFSFYPPSASFTYIGNIACPGSLSTPWSMAVDRKGIAYSVFRDGDLFRISTATAACTATPYVPNQSGFLTFGMGYAADTTGPGETLFVAETTFTPPSKGLATIDTSSFTLQFVGPFQPSIPGAELTGTADGRLYGYYKNPSGSGSHVVEIDKTTATIVADDALQVGNPNDSWAFAYWGGDFYVFTGTTAASTVTRFRPSDLSETTITTLPSTIVGAGVSTCAPAQ
jgi:hypothetical protein